LKLLKKRLNNLVSIVRNEGVLRALKAIYVYVINLSNNSNLKQPKNIYHKVSIIAVNFNGIKDLPTFFKGLNEQSYKNFQVIIIDNNSKDNSIEYINKIKKNVFYSLQVIKSPENIGFAGACNAALEYSRDFYVVFLNIDTYVDRNWLYYLVKAANNDFSASVVTSKTLFYRKFVDYEFRGTSNFTIDLNKLLRGMQYEKFFIRKGKISSNIIKSDDDSIVISLPFSTKKFLFYVKSKGESKLQLYIKNIFIKQVNFTGNTSFLYAHNIEHDFEFLVNNVGSGLDENGNPYDIGFASYDVGQYDSLYYTKAFCGCSFLIKRDAFIGRTLFVPEFFAYYEDSELSQRITSKILYTPHSIAYHKHSSFFSERSKLRKFLILRSYLIYKKKHNNFKKFKFEFELSKLYSSYRKYLSFDLAKTIRRYDKTLLERFEDNKDFFIKRKTIGIYNSYWATVGGAEIHALSLVSKFGEYDDVYLISENDFSIELLEQNFGIDLSRSRKIISNNINTKLFDTFVNSTYLSNLISQNIDSFYIVSFPQKKVSANFLKSYTFIFNSDYTKNWAIKYWGDEFNYILIYPTFSIGKEFFTKLKTHAKTNLILSVGRFFVGHHSKKQNFIIKAFLDSNLNKSDFKLSLIGGVDRANALNYQYYKSIESIVKLNKKSLCLAQNVSKVDLVRSYSEALFFVSASGLNEDPEKDPENFEHFGIAVLEAACLGSIPIVYHIGGPSATVDKLGLGFKFSSLGDLRKIFNKISDMNRDEVLEISRNISLRARKLVIDNNLQLIRKSDE